LVKPTNSCPRKIPNAITRAGPSHQSDDARRNEIKVTALVGPI
jgi:hypothetical protein